jgi:hypothetical protein
MRRRNEKICTSTGNKPTYPKQYAGNWERYTSADNKKLLST